jgi:hypothetical protein
MINDYLRGRAYIESVRGSVDFELLCMINDYLRGRACIESVRGSVDFELLC